MVEKIHGYIVDHDNRWSFIIAYIALAVILAIVINLFWLILVVAAHGLFEWITQRQFVRDRIGIAMRVLWELKLDIALILFALALEVYIEMVLGMVGLSAAARAGAQTGGRFVALQNALRGTLLSIDDAAQVVRMVAKRGGDEEGTDGQVALAGEEEEELDFEQSLADSGGRLGPWSGEYVLGDWFSIGFSILCLGLILVGPLLTPHDWSSMMEALGGQLDPWPWR
jgi:hypothetical protein